MAHAARAAADASRKASLAAANASLTLASPSSPEVDVFNYDSDEKNDIVSSGDTNGLLGNIIQVCMLHGSKKRSLSQIQA